MVARKIGRLQIRTVEGRRLGACCALDSGQTLVTVVFLSLAKLRLGSVKGGLANHKDRVISSHLLLPY